MITSLSLHEISVDGNMACRSWAKDSCWRSHLEPFNVNWLLSIYRGLSRHYTITGVIFTWLKHNVYNCEVETILHIHVFWPNKNLTDCRSYSLWTRSSSTTDIYPSRRICRRRLPPTDNICTLISNRCLIMCTQGIWAVCDACTSWAHAVCVCLHSNTVTLWGLYSLSWGQRGCPLWCKPFDSRVKVKTRLD